MIVFTALFYAICLILLLYALIVVKTYLRNNYILGKMPGPPRNSLLLGNMNSLWTTSENIFKILRTWGATYPIYQTRLLFLPAFHICRPEDAELILGNSVHIEKGMMYNMLHEWLGTGLLTSTAEKWQTRRKLLTPAFHFNILQQFVRVFNEETDKLVEVLKRECHNPYIEVGRHITQFTLTTIAETAMGTKLTFASKKERDYKEAILAMGEIFLHRLLHTWLIFKSLFIFDPLFIKQTKLIKILHSFTREIILEREKNFKESDLTVDDHDVYMGRKRLAMLDLLLMAKREDGVIDNEGIREEVDTFMFEGHDTTASSLGFTLMLLASHKTHQDRVTQEMVQVLGDLGKKPTYNDLQEMKYLERVIKESLRLYPSVHFISRTLSEDLVSHDGYLLPALSVGNIHIFDIHRHPEIYPDPEKFDPDRFLPENCQNRHPFAYLPFSAGPQNCIGQKFALMELKAAVCGILANFALQKVDNPKTIVPVVDLVLRTKNLIKIKFLPRERALDLSLFG